MDDFATKVYKLIPPMEVGELVEGIITKIDETGATVKISQDVYGWIGIDEITNTPIKNIFGYFRHGQPIRAKIISMNKTGTKLQLSIRQMPVYDRIMFRNMEKENFTKNIEDISIILDNYTKWINDKYNRGDKND